VKNHRALYIGKSGQLAVMAEFLLRGYNVAIPEIDVGDDIFVVRDDSGELSRIQVKSTVARRRGGDSPVFSAQFNVGVAQLAEERRPELHFVFAARCDGHWSEFLVIPRDRLQEHYAAGEVGTYDGHGKVKLLLRISQQDVACRGFSLQRYRVDPWVHWPPILGRAA